MKEDTVHQKGKWAGQAVVVMIMMMVVMMIPQVQPARTSGERRRGTCPMCRRKMARDDLRAAGS